MVLSEMDAIAFAREAEKEVRALDSPTQARLRRNLARLAEGAAGLDIKPLAGHPIWKDAGKPGDPHGEEDDRIARGRGHRG